MSVRRWGVPFNPLAQLQARTVPQQWPRTAKYPRGWNAEQSDRQKGQGMESLNDKAILRIIEYLRKEGWTEKKINDFIEYIVK